MNINLLSFTVAYKYYTYVIHAFGLFQMHYIIDLDLTANLPKRLPGIRMGKMTREGLKH